ncbi:IclR family transcriptional regulator [Agrobacterium sp. MCAB5]|uniref:IclR family transcriptional regulator n=1 Tax=Agrobacterium sp. MCAB5 TaxID=3233042 RepID=UPI003F9241CB
MTEKVHPRNGLDARGVQSVEVGLGILLPFLDAKDPLKLREVAERAGVPPTKAHAYLVSFRRMGLVEQDEVSGRYRLGPYALLLAIGRMRSFDAMKAAAVAVEALSEETGLTVAVSVWGSFGPTVVQIRKGVDQNYINTNVGTVYSVSGTAAGMVFAGNMPEATIRAAIRAEVREGGKTLRVGKTRAYSDIVDEIELVKNRGFATIFPRPVPGISAVGAPVIDHTEQVQMAVTLIGPESHLDIDPNGATVKKLLAVTKRLSFEHGYVSPR